MIKVLGLASYPILPAQTGGQKAIALFYKYFSKEVDLISVSTRKNRADLAEGYEMLNVLSDSPLRYINPFYFFTLRRIIRQRQITHLELEHPYYGWLAVMLKWFTGVKLIAHSYNIEGERWKVLGKWWWKGLWWYEKWLHRQADYNFFIQDNDRMYAIQHFGVLPQKAMTITYGIEWNKPPAQAEKETCRAVLLQQHNIPSHHRLLLFNGSFNYLPNLNALRHIIKTINPALQAHKDFHYTLLICGKDIPAELNGPYPNICIAGFVPDIALYFKGTDVFLNPVIEGGGIKTKLVEALASGMNAVSCLSGAIGVDPSICNGKLVIVPDNLDGFADAVIKATRLQAVVTEDFFRHFYWGHIAARAAAFITNEHPVTT